MKVFNIETVDGPYEVMGDRYSMTKYLTVYKDDQVVFEIRTTKVLSLK